MFVIFPKNAIDGNNEIVHHINIRDPKRLNIGSARKHLGAVELSVQADGDELDAIRDQFDNIPMHRTNRVMRWEGDIAHFIIDNIKI